MTDPTPLTDDELADLPDPALWGYGFDLAELSARLLATVDAERARADRAEKSKTALVAKVKRLEDRLAVAKGALPAGDVRKGWAAAVDRADQAETERDHLRAERDAARADRVCWREAHNQVAAERDVWKAGLLDFLDALVLAKRNDDVMSVVDAMLEVHVRQLISGTPGEDLTGDCEIDCQERCAYPGQFSECDLGATDLPGDTGNQP